MQECRRPPYRKLTRIATSVTNQKSVFWSVICLWTNQRPVLPLATVRRGFVESRHQHWWRSRSGRDLDPERHADTSLGLPHCILKLYSCRIKKNSLKSLKSLLHVINIYKQSFTTESWNQSHKHKIIIHLGSESYISHASPHPDSAILITLSAHQTADPDTPAVTSNTARPANDTSNSDVYTGKWGNLT